MTAINKVRVSYKAEASVVKPAWQASLWVMLMLACVIGLGALMRFYRLDDPLVGIRQNDMAAIARNFAEGTMNILYPQVDWGGASGGYVEAEFQAYTYAVAILYRIFGVHEWLGRALNIGVYALSALLLFRLSRRLFNPRVAMLATLFYAFAPLSYVFTRAFQSDALMSLGSLAGIYYFLIWSEEDRRAALLLSVLGVTLAVLIKPTNLYLGLPLLYLSYRKYGDTLTRKPVLWLYAAVICASAVLWYAHAINLWRTYGNTFGIFDSWLKVGLPNPSFLQLLAQELLTRLILQTATPAGLLLLLVGLFMPPRDNPVSPLYEGRRVVRHATQGKNLLLHWWAIGFAISVWLASLGHYTNDYEQLPIVFVALIWIACGVNFLWETRPPWSALTRTAALMACLSFVGFSFWQLTIGDLGNWTHLSAKEWDRVHFAERVASLTEPAAPVIFARTYRGNPQLYQHRTAQGEFLECDPVDFYRSHRKGWSLDELQATPEFVETLRQRGAQYFATAYPEMLERHPELKAALERSYVAVEVTPRWVIYKLERKTAQTTP